VAASVLEKWIWEKADPDDWNKRENGTSAQVFNSLWNARNFDQMVKLIERKFDAGQAHNTEKDLKHWKGEPPEGGLSETVIFLRKGRTVPVTEVEDWVEMMKTNDQKTTRRPAPRKQKLATELKELSPHLLDDDDVTDSMGLKMVIKSNTLVRVAKMKAEGPLLPYLKNKCELLYRFGVLPKGLAGTYEAMLAAKEEAQRKSHRETVAGLIEPIVSAKLKDALKARMVDRAT
jgi:hypothetical protein